MEAGIIKNDGVTRSSGRSDKKQDAVDAGRKISKNPGAEPTARTGRFRTRTASGNDPYPPEG